MSGTLPRFSVRTRMRGRGSDEAFRVSSPLEALFDLTFVVAIAQLADQLGTKIEHGFGVPSLVSFLMVFFAIWWAWINFTWFSSAYDTDDVPYRLLTLVQMAGVLVLAAGIPAAFQHENFFGMTLGYLIMRLALVAQWIRAAIEDPDGRTTAIRYAAGVTIVQLGWLARLFIPVTPSNTWWTVYVAFIALAALEMIVPYWAERTGFTGWHPHHIAERYGLFAIILLGETIAALASGLGEVINAGDRIGPLVTVGCGALVLIFALWWLYFLQPSGEGLEANREGAFFWGYAHYFVFGSLAALGAGLEVVVNSAGGKSHVPDETALYAIAIPVAVYLVFLMVAHLRIVARTIVHLPVKVAGAVVILLLPLAAGAFGLPVVVVLIAVAAAVVVAVSIAVGRREAGEPQ